MYNEKLENLIEMALMDGELTEKEKQVLFKTAESFGVDLDEFEMVLDAKLFEKQKKAKLESSAIPPSPPAAPKSDKFGDVRKCPSCAAILQSFQTKCDDCGHEFLGIEANATIERLFKMLNEAESTRKNDSGGLLSSYMRLIEGLDPVEKKKLNIISNFPIPNTKEDILEFLSLAAPQTKYSKFSAMMNGREGKKEIEFAKVWRSKCEQIIMKARFSMKEDKKILEEINYYAKLLKIK